MPMYRGGAWVLIHWANCRHAVGTAQAWSAVLAPWWYHVQVSGCYLLLESQPEDFSTGGMGNCLGKDVPNPGHLSGKNDICKCLNVDGGGRIGYCDSLWCGASVEGNSAVYHMQLGHWQFCKTRSGVRQNAALGEISTGGSAGALLHLSAFCTALSQTLQLYAALLLAVWCG